MYLWVVPTNICEKLVNEPAHQGSGCVNSCNELRYNLVCRKTQHAACETEER